MKILAAGLGIAGLLIMPATGQSSSDTSGQTATKHRTKKSKKSKNSRNRTNSGQASGAAPTPTNGFPPKPVPSGDPINPADPHHNDVPQKPPLSPANPATSNPEQR